MLYQTHVTYFLPWSTKDGILWTVCNQTVSSSSIFFGNWLQTFFKISFFVFCTRTSLEFGMTWEGVNDRITVFLVHLTFKVNQIAHRSLTLNVLSASLQRRRATWSWQMIFCHVRLTFLQLQKTKNSQSFWFTWEWDSDQVREEITKRIRVLPY